MRLLSCIALIGAASCHKEVASGDLCLRETLGPAGGSLVSSELTLSVPNGALEEPTEIELCPILVPDGIEAHSTVWQLSEVTFSVPAMVKLTHDESDNVKLFTPGLGGTPVRNLLATPLASGVLSGPVYRGGWVYAAEDERILESYTPTDAVDLLFVIDNSCNMEEHQARLAALAPLLFDSLSERDFHVGVVTTDIDNPISAGILIEIDDQPVITPQHTDPAALWAQMIQPGSDGSSIEEGLGAAYLALELFDRFSFRRPEAALTLLIASDEDDQTSPAIITPSEFSTWLANFGVSAPVSFYALVPTTYRNAAVNYIDVASRLDGRVEEINTPDWDPLFDVFINELTYPGVVLPRLPDAVPEAWALPADGGEPVEFPVENISWDGAHKLRITESPPPDSTVWLLY